MSTKLFWKFFLPSVAVNAIAILGTAWLAHRADASLVDFIPYGVGFFVAASFACWWLVKRTIGPLDTLGNATRQIVAGNFTEPVYFGVRGDFRKLASQLNTIRSEMSDRTEEMTRLTRVLAAMTDGVIALDDAQRIQFANAAAGQLLGFNPEEAHGRPLLEAVRNNKLQELVVRLRASQRQEEIEIKWGDDNLRNLLVHATSANPDASDNGMNVSIVLMIYNLSEVRRLDAMRRDFVANVSHELKTPLSSIKAYAETLSAGAINDEANRSRFVAQIEEQADRLHQLISDLLSLARIEQGNQLLEIQQIPIAQVVKLCVKEQQRAALQKNIELVIESSDDAVCVNVDEDGLRQILVNLIDNAIKYTPDGGKVSVGWNQEATETTLTISDTGIGIPDDMKERVFERFFRVDKARSRELGGTGLGLAIVKHLAQSFGGGVAVANNPAGGTRFIVKFPRT